MLFKNLPSNLLIAYHEYVLQSFASEVELQLVTIIVNGINDDGDVIQLEEHVSILFTKFLS